MNEIKITPLQCHKCQHKWDYKGNSGYYATCPNCLSKVKVKQQTEKKTEDEVKTTTKIRRPE